MVVYIGLWVIVVLCALLEVITEKKSPKYKKEKKIYFWCCLISLWIIGVGRAELLGVDVSGYKEYFYDRGRYTPLECIKRYWDSDVGYYLFGNLIYHYASKSFLVYRNILYTITLGLFAIVIYKKSPYPAISFLIFLGLGLLGYVFCLLRQAVAIPLCLLGYIYGEEKKYIRSILLIFLATMFHATAIFFILIYIFVSPKRKKLNLYSNFIFLFITIILAAVLMPKFISIYRDGRYEENFVKGQGAWLLLFCIAVIVILIRLIFMTDQKDIDRRLIQRFDVSCSAIYMQTGALFFSLFSRIGIYFSSIFILTVPYILQSSKEKSFWKIAIIAMFSFMYILFLLSNYTKIVPYNLI